MSLTTALNDEIIMRGEMLAESIAALAADTLKKNGYELAYWFWDDDLDYETGDRAYLRIVVAGRYDSNELEKVLYTTPRVGAWRYMEGVNGVDSHVNDEGFTALEIDFYNPTQEQMLDMMKG